MTDWTKPAAFAQPDQLSFEELHDATRHDVAVMDRQPVAMGQTSDWTSYAETVDAIQPVATEGGLESLKQFEILRSRGFQNRLDSANRDMTAGNVMIGAGAVAGVLTAAAVVVAGIATVGVLPALGGVAALVGGVIGGLKMRHDGAHEIETTNKLQSQADNAARTGTELQFMHRFHNRG